MVGVTGFEPDSVLDVHNAKMHKRSLKLASAVRIMKQVVKGTRTVESMGEWLKNTFPRHHRGKRSKQTLKQSFKTQRPGRMHSSKS